jgi:thiamine-monophosphate kinase
MSDNGEKRTEISSLGEFGLIDHLTGKFEAGLDSTIKGIGDDAAVIKSGNEALVVTTDILTEGIHFDLAYMPLKHLGYKAVIASLSDVYAMNAVPTQLTFSISVSSRFSVEALDELYEGIQSACTTYGVDLVGGDTTSSAGGLFLSVTALGRQEIDKITYRSGAKKGDLLVVSGDLGGAFAGLQLLEREKSVFQENPEIQPKLQGHEFILRRQMKPEARKDVFEVLDEMKILPTAMIDISDGLSSDVMHLCKSSGTGCIIKEEDLPIHEETRDMALEFNLDPTMCVMNGGEDYELLFTIDPSDAPKVAGNPYFSVIGEMTDAAKGQIMLSGARLECI